MIDASALAGDSAYRGIGTYLRQLLEALIDERDLTMVALAQPRVPLPQSVERVPIHRLAPGRWRAAQDELLLPLDMRRRAAHLFHSPALNPPRRSRLPWVQTLHDVIPLVFDDPELAVERRRWQRQASRIRSAQHVIAISRHTAQVGIGALGLDSRRIEVVPHGVGKEFQPGDRRREAAAPYLLSVGEYSRRKGYPEAFAVIGALAELGYPHRLRVCGRLAPWVRPAVQALIAAAPAPERIDLLGYVDDLPAQYRGAELMIMTSRYEGFGLPILEAMACGTPVVAFANSSIPEVVGDAGLLVQDGDVAAMTRAVRMVLADRRLWEELSCRGLERARGFTWAKSAAAHAQIYRAVCSASWR